MHKDLRLTTLASLATCLLLAGCPSAEPGDNGTVKEGTGGRDGNSISLFSEQILLFHGDDDVPPSQHVGILHEGSRITITQVDGTPLPAWLSATPVVRESDYISSLTLAYVPQSQDPHIDQTTLRFSVSDADGSNVIYDDVPVVAAVEHRLSSRREYITHTAGMPDPAIRLQLVADGNWQATANEPWAQLSPASGRGSASIDIALAASQLAVGDHPNGISLYVPATQRVKVFWAFLGIDPRRLETDQRALAFSATLGASRLTRELRIIDTAGLAGRWSLSDDAPWLQASANSGTGSGLVTLTADATGLADGLHSATLTLSPDNDSGFANDSVVRVALHVDRTTAASPSVPLQGAAPTGVIVADPLRPLLYGFDQAGADSTLRTWNVHTGALVNTLPLPSVRVSQAHVSPDGSLLLIADSLNRKLVPVGLRPGAITLVSPWNTMRFPDGAADFGFARLNGSDVIVWSGGQLLSAESSASLANHEFFPASLGNSPASLAVAADGRRGCMILHTASGAQLLYLVQGNRAGRFSGGIAEPLPLADGAHRCALDATGDNVFVTGDSGLRRFAFQGRDSIRRTAASSAVTLQLLANGEIYAVGGTQWLHLSSQLDELGRRTLAAGSVDGVISGDETRLLERVVDGTQVTATLRDRDF